MTYRPKDWELPIGIADKSLKKNHTYKLILSGENDKRYSMSLLTERDKNLFEAGADAMLEAILKTGQYISNQVDKKYFNATVIQNGTINQDSLILARSLKKGESGTLVFIPDKE
jgi:hypothetical protein